MLLFKARGRSSITITFSVLHREEGENEEINNPE